MAINIKKKVPKYVWITGLVLVILVGSFFLYNVLTQRIVFGQPFKTVNFEGQMASVVSNGTSETIFLKGEVVSKTDSLFYSKYSFSITESLLNTSTLTDVFLPKNTNLTAGQGCVILKLDYLNLLGLRLFRKVDVTSCGDYQGITDHEFLQEAAVSFLEKVDETSDGKYPFWLTCKTFTGNCELGSEDYKPYNWVNYAFFGNDMLDSEVADYSTYLDDLTDESIPVGYFESRLFQYGDIVLSSDASKAEYADDYIAVVRERYDESYYTDPGYNSAFDFMYFTEYVSTLPVNFGNEMTGTGIENSTNMAAVGSIELSNAYKMTQDRGYLFGAISLLNQVHLFLYYENDIEPSLTDDIDFKTSSCYAIQAGARLYDATGDRKFLGYVDYIVTRGDIKKIYGERTFAENQSITNDPMNILPCIDAFETLYISDPDNRASYQDQLDILYGYVISSGMIELDTLSQGYGAIKGTRYSNPGASNIEQLYEVSSTGWWAYLLSKAISRETTTEQPNFMN
ncbi:hypothetical protein JW962_00625 [Candidatus Dojkabacteria bacterium]|nr:hypothetical protein [Candidatus Dojkabacteria bacterium]